jgi:hypothetical protein
VKVRSPLDAAAAALLPATRRCKRLTESVGNRANVVRRDAAQFGGAEAEAECCHPARRERETRRPTNAESPPTNRTGATVTGSRRLGRRMECDRRRVHVHAAKARQRELDAHERLSRSGNASCIAIGRVNEESRVKNRRLAESRP